MVYQAREVVREREGNRYVEHLRKEVSAKRLAITSFECLQLHLLEVRWDVLMGVIASNCPELKKTLSFIQNSAGSVPGPLNCWLAHRGLKTLHLRAPVLSRSAGDSKNIGVVTCSEISPSELGLVAITRLGI